MTTIYIVTSGDYSDYGIRAVFTDKALAEQLVALRGSEYEVKEHEADPRDWIAPAGMSFFRVKMARDGAVLVCERDSDGPGLQGPRTAPFKSYWWPRGGGLGDPCIATECWARDEAHATKIAGERRAQFVASGAWEKIR